LKLAQMFTDQMNHNVVENALGVLSARPLERRGFHFAKPLVLAPYCFAALALALVGPGFTVSASAQTMGEYGGVTAHSVGAAASMPKVAAPDLGRQVNSAPGNPSGASHNDEIRTYETPSNDRSENDKDTDKDDSSHGDWEQVK
jgi:hypothetical protein